MDYNVSSGANAKVSGHSLQSFYIEYAATIDLYGEHTKCSNKKTWQQLLNQNNLEHIYPNLKYYCFFLFYSENVVKSVIGNLNQLGVK